MFLAHIKRNVIAKSTSGAIINPTWTGQDWSQKQNFVSFRDYVVSIG